MGCGCHGNNVNCDACQSTVKTLGNTGKETRYSATHHDITTVTLTMPNGNTITAAHKERQFSLTMDDTDIASGMVACQNQDATSYAGGATWASTRSAGLSEQLDSVTVQVRYLDLRNNIIVYKETTESLPKQTLTDGGTLQWNSYGSVITVHELTGKTGFDVVTTEREVADGTELYRRAANSIAEIPAILTVPPSPGTPQYNSQKSYYIYDDNKDADGGYDLYYPSWLRGIGIATDEADRDLHKKIYDNSFVPSGALPTAVLPVTTPQEATGSWAVDRDGNKFFSQSHLGGVYALIKTADGSIIDPATVVNISGGNQRFHPVAPV